MLMKLSSLAYYGLRPKKALQKVALTFYEWRHPDEPWIAQGATRFLETHLRPEHRVFEWGSGRSTAWFARRTQQVISIEYDELWARKVRQSLQEQNLANTQVHFIPLEHDKKAPTPEHYSPIPKYVAALFDHPKESFGLIVVDGHYRLTCVAQCLPWVSPGGYLLIDNSNRVPREEWKVPQHWPQVHQSENVMTETTIWQRPKS